MNGGKAMSWSMWTVTGYGIDEADFTTSTDAEIAFLKKHCPKIYEDMLNDMEISDVDASDTAAYIDYCGEWIADFEGESGNTGFMVILAGAIRENEGIDVQYYNGDEESAILYTERLPWEMTEKEKALTEEDMATIFKKYLDELGVKAPTDRYSIMFSS